ncbi:MAG: ABC transporter substrate-binding protein [Alphaproteobacteria bacterium]|jgi:ABC-type nitrate/sulfonate/bicarbonate transport system substrate-binding protein|nr:ABC transporter substrate-binding protein [Alphaproteobacteria bacterium]MBU1277989.1 ABC transporter substrate-binding protein [Alphaproteobacteria bacterium]MBU1575013.1 ABC transporter substrate-binding protein [Alphaproteobacteria bacterium]MBU1829186.1 ABC transporter substrate-binding protein [Alphaproteobacteria bacterium]MBU2078058.1 ABC transporter substrate-binding protein [Alphaproteobacteria bacterium]
MRAVTVSVGFIPLVDAAPLIVAQEMGFAAEEGINLALKPAPSWSSLRDMLSFGQVEAAHMLSPIPVATALGLGGAGAKLSAVSVLSVNGNVIGVSNALAARLHDQGHDFGFNDAYKAGTALIGAAKGRLRIGVPFPFSMHAELLYYWLSALGLPAPQSVDIHTVPPPLMADAMEAGDIDAFCVGEPWGSQAVDTGVGQLLLPGSAIWSCAPEKVLAVRSDWAEQESALMGRLIRAVWRAGRWLGEPDSRMLTSELLSRPEYLDLPSDMLERALMGRLVIGPAGEERHVDGFVEFFKGAATFPWRSQAEWIGMQLATRMGLDQAMARNVAGGVFRSDLHRQALAGTTADLPGASSKVEGGLEAPMAVASEAGHLILGQNRFFDGRVFDPKGD